MIKHTQQPAGTMSPNPAFYTPFDCDLAVFESEIDRHLLPGDIPQATEIFCNVPVYDMAALRPALSDPPARLRLLSEWATGLASGAGVLALRNAYPDAACIDDATAIFEAIIAEEKTDGGADHFAAAGANDRVWNSAQKLCERDPAVFARYFGNPAIAAVCEAWLGPGYQMTAQVNLVRPGGGAQQAHRDYHLGFQTAETAARFPAHAHPLTAALTLQGAVAHCDMPLESGPTKLLPFSQTYGPGYLAFHRDDFRALFEERCVQIPLRKGDAVFFSPALFHAAGANTSTDIQRMANLLQVSSPFGRAMEAVDRVAMARRLYPALATLKAAGEMDDAEVAAAIAACAEGYAFPTNLDSDPPTDGNAPESQAALMAHALAAGWSADAFDDALADRVDRMRP